MPKNTDDMMQWVIVAAVAATMLVIGHSCSPKADAAPMSGAVMSVVKNGRQYLCRMPDMASCLAAQARMVNADVTCVSAQVWASTHDAMPRNECESGLSQSI